MPRPYSGKGMACGEQDTCSSILGKNTPLPSPPPEKRHSPGASPPSLDRESKTPLTCRVGAERRWPRLLQPGGAGEAGDPAPGWRRAELVTWRCAGGAWGGRGERRGAGAGPGCHPRLRLVGAAPVSMCRAVEAQHSSPGAGPAGAGRKRPRRSCGAWGRWRRSRPRLKQRRLW